jgi:YidC/Oxa1 family membrane protein insertase
LFEGKTGGEKGWYPTIGEPLLEVLDVLADGLFNNFALAIIAFTVLTRLVLLPVTIKQFRSSREMNRKMRILKPRLEAIKKKYKNDRAKQTTETMKAYKEVGFSPLGCLTSPMLFTMLLQLPFFIIIIAAIKILSLHPEEYMVDGISYTYLWGLFSVIDPHIVPAIFVGGLMFISQRLMQEGGAEDPQTKMMNTMMGIMMPLVMAWICLLYGSGFALYLLVSTAASVAVQYYVRRGDEPLPAVAGIAPKKEASPSSGKKGRSGEEFQGDGGEDSSVSSPAAGTPALVPEAIKPERHRADVTTSEQTSHRKEYTRHGKSRSKRKNRRRGRRERPAANRSQTGVG